MRDAFVSALLAARANDPRLFVLDGDCSRSTRSGAFGQAYPASFLNLGIAEQNLVGVAAGLALTGLHPVVCGFASILTGRAAEQILLSVALPGLPVTIAGHYAGMSGAKEGAPHHAVADLAFARSVPGLDVWVPADDGDVAQVMSAALTGERPCYVRLARDAVAALDGDRRAGDGTIRVWDGGSDVVIIAAGVPVTACVAAAALLAARGVSATVVALLRLKPFPTDPVLHLVADAGAVVVVEEHSVIGGLGGAVAEALSAHRHPPVTQVGIRDRFSETGTYDELLSHHSLNAAGVAAASAAALHHEEVP